MQITVRERSPLLDSLRWLLGGAPAWLVRLLSGDATTLTIPGTGQARRGRPVKVLVGPELILSRRLRLPLAGKADLKSAIRLLIETETPFRPNELIVHAERLPAPRETTQAVYEIRLVPRQNLLAELAARGIRPAQITGIADRSTPDRTDFSRSAFPLRAAMRWAFVVPLLIVVACVALLLGEATQRREANLAHLAAAESARLEELRRASDELDDRRQALMGTAEVVEALSASASVFNLMTLVRAALPADVQVLRLDYSDRALQVPIRAADALAIAQGLGGTMSAKIDGAITIDPGSGLEQATIRIAEPSGANQ